MRPGLQNLLPLLQILKDREQSKMAKIVNRVEQLRSGFQEMNCSEPVLGGQIEAERNWLIWVGKERIRINQELAIAIVERESQKQSLGKAVGRFEVLQSIRTKNR